MNTRDHRCAGCPFAGKMARQEVLEVLEGPKPALSAEVLCHHAGFEDDGPHAFCRGFADNASRLGVTSGN